MSDQAHLGPEIAYLNGRLHMDGVDLAALADDPSITTPAYIYSSAMIRRRYGDLHDALRSALGLDAKAMAEKCRLCYAVKALSNPHILALFRDLGAGVDLVSRGELERVLALGFDPAGILYSGLGKTADDIDRALAAGVQLNVESISELSLAQQRAAASGVKGRVAFRLNPQLDSMRAHHGHITTGKPDSKFGIAWDMVRQMLPDFGQTHPDLILVGVSVHIGSNMVPVPGAGDHDDFQATFSMVRDEVLPALIQAGVEPPVRLDLGGGIGVDYDAEPGTADGLRQANPAIIPYAALVAEAFKDLVAEGQVHLQFEPGRVLVGEAGLLLSRILHVKDNGIPEGEPFAARFIVADAGMNDLSRPGLYGAYHGIVPVKDIDPDLTHVDICGPVCETTDSFMRPSAEWLGRHTNILTADSKAELERADQDHGERILRGGRFGEVAPGYTDDASGTRRTYEYFVKRRFPASVAAGDLLAILHTGAYGAVMASTYNARDLPQEILVDRGEYRLIS